MVGGHQYGSVVGTSMVGDWTEEWCVENPSIIVMTSISLLYCLQLEAFDLLHLLKPTHLQEACRLLSLWFAKHLLPCLTSLSLPSLEALSRLPYVLHHEFVDGATTSVTIRWNLP